MNILVLPRLDYFPKYDEFRDNLDQKFSEWLIINKFTPIIFSNSLYKIHNLRKMLIKLEIKGVILTGGDFSKKTDRFKTQKKILEIAKEQKIPVLGICQGMQMISVFFGGKLKKVKNHVRTFHYLTSTKKNRFPSKIKCYYQYALKSCPKNFEITSLSDDKIIESIKHKRLKWEGWMWHPERNKKFNKYDNLNLKRLFREQ